MKTITFTEDREFDYGQGVILHQAGDKVAVHRAGPDAKIEDGAVVSLREDKAQRWLGRGAARADVPEGEDAGHDNAVEGSANVAGQDSGGAGERPVNEPASGKSGQKGKGGNRRQ